MQIIEAKTIFFRSVTHCIFFNKFVKRDAKCDKDMSQLFLKNKKMMIVKFT